jgi:ribosomal protein S18 acetylase RimI-like enzyme
VIISIDETRVVEAAEYANRLNQINKPKCKSCATEYERMLSSFRKKAKHSDDEVLICIEDNEILGVLAVCVVPKEKYIEAVDGVYAKEKYQEIAMLFFKHLKKKYDGFHFDAVYSQENKEAICFMESIGANCISIDLEMKLIKDDFESLKGNKQILPLSYKYYESFRRLHDENHLDVYWTGDRLLAALDKFDVFIALEKDELVGSIVTSTGGGKREGIYFIETDKRYRRQGYAKGLLGKSIDKAFLSGASELVIQVEIENSPAINLYKSFGFQKVYTSNTYSIEAL